VQLDLDHPDLSQPHVTSLDLAPHSQWLEVLDLPRGRRASLSLAQLGVHVNEKLRVLSIAPMGGPVLVEAAGSTIAIGRSLAARIRVRMVNAPNGKDV
jgi:Fe2+ transport system protein FeoA